MKMEEFLSKCYGKMKSGEVKIVNGEIIGFEPDLAKMKPLIAGLPKELSDSLQEQLIEKEEKPLNDEDFLLNQEKIATTYAKYYGEFLSEDKKKELIELYSKTARNSLELSKKSIEEEIDFKNQDVDKKKKERKLRDIQLKNAEIMAEFVFKELKIFCGNPKSQKRRYTKWIGKKIPDESKMLEALKTSFRSLITGDYLKKDRERITERKEKFFSEEQDNGQKNPHQYYKTEMREAKRVYTTDFHKLYPTDLEDLFKLHKDEWKPQIEEYSPEPYGWVVRIFTGEHPIPGRDQVFNSLTIQIPEWDWTALLDDMGLVHVGVIVGIWQLWKQDFEEIYWISDYIAKVRKYRKYYGTFREWIVANGSASWFYSDDKLHVKASMFFSTYNTAKRYAKSSTPTSGGKYYPNRACAYSVGRFGHNWVCHQNCNSFTKRKYNMIVVNYPSINIFGWYSNYPTPQICRREDPFWHYYPLRGGLPGNNLYYHMISPYNVPDPIYLTVDYLMDGGGFGLRRRWNPAKGANGEWQDTKASLETKSYSEIPFLGWTWEIGTFLLW